MRRLLVEVTCDKCSNITAEDEAVNVELVLSNEARGTLEIDLCSGCLDDFVYGSRIKPKPKSRKKIDSVTPASPADGAEEHKCTVCGKSYNTDRGLRVHQKKAEH